LSLSTNSKPRTALRQRFFLLAHRRTATVIATFIVFASLATVFVWRQVFAANILWSASGGSAWLTTGNWAGGAIPSGTDVAQFGVNPTSGTTGVGINFNSTTNAGTQVNGQRIEEVGAVEITSARAAALLIGNSSSTAGATGTFRLNGAAVNSVAHVIIRNSSNQLLTIQNTQGSGNQTMSVALNDAADNIINLDGSGGTTISSIVKNAAGNHITLGGIGSGTLTLSGANTYTGGTTINSAKAVATVNSALGAGNVTVNTSGVGLTLQGAFNNYIADTATVTIASGAKMALNQTGGSDTVGALVLGGVAQASAGTYGSSASGATFVNDTFFSGTGTLTLAGGSTNPSGSGAANPSSVAPTQTTLLTVTVTPGTNPTSVTHTVVANLSDIGGSASQTFFDDGSNGDVTLNDNIFSFTATVANGTSGGNKSLPFTITETSPPSRTGSGSISLNVLASTNPSGTGTANPNSVLPGASTLLTVNVTPGTNLTSTGLAVTADLSSIGGSASQAFSGSGNTFTFTATVGNATTPGLKGLPFTITDAQLRSGSGSISLTVLTPPPPNDVVISQVFGGGGNSGSLLKNDFIELINHSNSPVNLDGWSVQVFVTPQSPGTPHWEMTPLPIFTLQPGQYFLIQEAAQGGGTEDLPAADAIGNIPVSSSSTKVALVNNTTLITATCPSAGVVDLVGYGPTNCFETSPAPALPDNTTAVLRRNEGCFDTDNNANDFVLGEPNPRNSSSPFHGCTALSAYGSANPSTVLQGDSSTLTVYVAAAQNPASTGITVAADLSAIGGPPNQAFANSGNNVFTFNATVPVNQSTGMKSFPVAVSDTQGRTANTNILVSVLSTTPEHVTISQVYGGGGNSGATYSNDYVELYNPTAATISMTGWSLQYGSATGTSFSGKQVLGGTIDPGHYYLVSLASGGAVGALLPPASVSGTDINMAAAAGKIVLVSNSDTLIGACPVGIDPDIVDFVGYGTTANCREGAANAPAPSVTTAIFRKTGGGTDTDQNGNDFVVGAPNPRSTTPVVEFGPSVAGTDPTANATIAPYDSSITADFSEPVDAVGVWYNVTCTITGLHNDGTVAHSDDFKTWAFTPNTTFQFGEQCTATIYKNQIHDQDTNDSAPETDTLSADYVWSFTVVGAGQAAPYPPSVHLTMGNPSNAVADVSQPLNYLMMKPTYAVSYNRDKGTPNWVSWHLDSSWYGSLARVDTFRPDPAVDPSWYRVQAFDYSLSGFDRGHMTPNADRDNQNRIPINQETYLMSNMVPQAPDNNQGPWANLEAALRTLADGGNELYIISGPLGVGGIGSASGNTVNTIANGHVTVPASTWKVALVLQSGSGDDVARVTCSTRTIAVLMPNTQGIRNTPWQSFLTTVDAIEQATGYDLYSNLPPAVQACVEAGTNGVNPPGTADQSTNTTEDNAVTVTLQALQSNNNSLTFSIVNGPASGSLGTVGSSSCSSGTCTATVTYTPVADFNGSDTFTFKASDGTLNSNTSTVTVGITEVNDPPSASNDSKSTQEDTPLSFPSTDLTANDSAGPANESGQVLTVTSVTDAGNAHGTVVLNSGMVTYTPAANYNGPASFTYTVCDDGTTNGAADSKCATATVNVNVEAVNDNPVAVDDSATTNEDNSVTIDVVANDTDVDGDARSLASVGSASHGSVSIVSGKAFYSPASNYNGADSFTYVVSDGHGGQATGNVTITINPINDAPTANSQSASTNSNMPVAITLTGSDVETPSGSLTFTVTSGPSHGSLSGTGANRTYTPGLNYSGPDSFKFTVTDTGDGASLPLTSSEATVSITVNDTVGPTITLNGNSISLWPPNKKFHTITVADLVASASDNFDPNVNINSVVISSVSSDEGTAASGDIVIAANCKSVQLRADRNGNGDGRVYTITFKATDAAGNTTFVTAKVTVPHDQGNGNNAVDSGPAYTVNSNCP